MLHSFTLTQIIPTSASESDLSDTVTEDSTLSIYERIIIMVSQYTHHVDYICVRSMQFFKPVDGLPDSKGSLSLSVPSQAIASANWEVLKSTSEVGKKRGPYNHSVSVSAVC